MSGYIVECAKVAQPHDKYLVALLGLNSSHGSQQYISLSSLPYIYFMSPLFLLFTNFSSSIQYIVLYYSCYSICVKCPLVNNVAVHVCCCM